MSQVALPFQDISNSGWTPLVVFNQINQKVPDDTTYVSSSQSPEGDEFEVKLDGLAWPADGPETLIVRLRQTGSVPVMVTVALFQGATFITGRNFQPTQSFQNYVMVLTDYEKVKITNYADLRVRITAGYSVVCYACPNKLPVLFHGTITNKEGDYVCLPDSLALYFSGINVWSTGNFGICPDTPCRQSTAFAVECREPWLLASFPGYLADLISESCHPFALTFQVYQTGTCVGSFTLTITT